MPSEHVERTLAAIIEQARAWTRGLVALPDGEEIVLEIERDVPWMAYCSYLGDFQVVLDGEGGGALAAVMHASSSHEKNSHTEFTTLSQGAWTLPTWAGEMTERVSL